MTSQLKTNIKFAAFMFIAYSCLSVMFSYIVVYLEWIGAESSTIGLIIAASSAANVLGQVVYGYLGDYVVTIKKILFCCITVSFILTFFLPFLSDYFVIFVMIYLIACLAGKPITSLLSSYTAKAGNAFGVNYSAVRAFGSVGYGVSALVIGRVIIRFGYDFMFYIHSGLLVAAFLMLTLIPEIPIAERKKGSDEQMNMLKAIKTLFKIPEYFIFIISCFIGLLGVWSCLALVPLLVTSIGRDSSFLGVVLFLGSIIEVPMFFLYVYVIKLANVKTLIAAALIMFIIRLLSVAIFFSDASVIFSQMLMGIGFSIFVASYIEYIRKIIPSELTATAIGVTEAMTGAVANIVGMLAAGFIVSAFGIRFLFLLAGISAVIGLLIFVIGNYMLSKKGLLIDGQ
ncbi:MAG: MFS transporter [Defluviitaleaceae bacterium]|nr:MFS transporter [Defluviitaleaceae bacterium]